MDPWAVLPPHITVLQMRLEHLSAVTDGHSMIWLDDRLTATEARCALLHELLHIEAGHTGHQPETVERKIREQVARLLIPFDMLWAVRHWQGPVDLLAEDLGVTPEVLADRMRWLTAEEEALVWEVLYSEAGEC